jgi:cobalt/nickel transport protein
VRRRFLLGFLVVALLVAGGVSYLASADPDGLDSVARHGCTEQNGRLSGTCIAQNATEHHTSGSPLADYALFGGHGTVGIAGILGVLVVLVLAGGLFRVLRRRTPARDE